MVRFLRCIWHLTKRISQKSSEEKSYNSTIEDYYKQTRFFFLSVFPFSEHLRITRQQGNGENASNSSLSFLSALDMSRGITAESLPLHIASDRIHTANPCFPSAGR